MLPPPISTSSPKGSPERSLNVTDANESVTSRGSKRVDVSKISRLLDHLTYDDDGLCEYDYNTDDNTDDVCFYPVNEEASVNSDKGNFTSILRSFIWLFKKMLHRFSTSSRILINNSRRRTS